MAQDLYKTTETGIYHVGEIPTKKDIKGTYKFVVRSTVTVNGIKKTIRETVEELGVTYGTALKNIAGSKKTYKDNARDKVLGVKKSDDTVKTITLDEVWENYVRHKDIHTPKYNDRLHPEYNEEKYSKDVKSTKPWAPKTLKAILSAYKVRVKPYIGKKRAIQVGYADIASCIQVVRDKGLSPRAERAVVDCLKPMFTWWYKNNHMADKIPYNPAYNQDCTTQKPREVNLEWDEIQKLFEVMYSWKDERYRQVWIWLSTGRRINEVLTMRHEHIKDGYVTIAPENNKIRGRKKMIYKVPEGATIPTYEGWIHSAPRDRDKMLSDNSVNGRWQVVLATAGIEDFHKHDLRHIIETVMSDSEVPQETINLVTGHLEAGASKHYKNDTTATADRKHRAVTFFLAKVFNRIDRKMLWNEYIPIKE